MKVKVCIPRVSKLQGLVAQWLEHSLDKRGVASSTLARPTEAARLLWGISSAGRAPDLHSGGQRFDPVMLHNGLRKQTKVSEYRFRNHLK